MLYLETTSLEKLNEILTNLPLAERGAHQAVALNLYGPQILVRQFELPGLSDKDIKNALRLEAAETFSLLPDEIEIDYQTFNASDNKTKGVFLAIPKSLLNDYLLLLKNNNLKPAKITAGIFSRLNYFLHYNKPENKNFSLVHFYKGNIMDIAAFNKDGECELLREIHFDNMHDAEREIIYSLKYASSRSIHKKLYDIYISGDLIEKDKLFYNLGQDLHVAVKEYNADIKLDAKQEVLFFNINLMKAFAYSADVKKKILYATNAVLAVCLLLTMVRVANVVRKEIQIRRLSSTYNTADYNYAKDLIQKTKPEKNAK